MTCFVLAVFAGREVSRRRNIVYSGEVNEIQEDTNHHNKYLVLLEDDVSKPLHRPKAN